MDLEVTMTGTSREDTIQKYFSEGYSYEEIRKILSQEGFEISYRQLQRIIKSMGLKKKKIYKKICQKLLQQC